MKGFWGRLGAAVGVLALLLGGLVGVAAPASANDTHKGWAQVQCPDGRVIVAEINGQGNGKCGSDEGAKILKRCAEGPEGEAECALV